MNAVSSLVLLLIISALPAAPKAADHMAASVASATISGDGGGRPLTSEPSLGGAQGPHETADPMVHRAYWRAVSDRLLGDAEATTECPPALDAASCLLGARLFWYSSGLMFEPRPAGGSALAPGRTRLLALLNSAAERANGDPEVLWLLARSAMMVEAPELRDRALAELRRREPENLQVWLLALGGESWTPERLDAAGRSTRSNAYVFDFMRRDLQRLAKVATDAPPAEWTEDEPLLVETHQLLLWALLSAEMIPAMQSLVEVCKTGASAPQAAPAAECWRIAERMVVDAESMMDLALGSALMRGSARRSLQQERANVARREYEYLQQRAVELHSIDANARAHQRRLRENGATELSALRSALRAAGLPITPTDAAPVLD